jgi:hypothetical protein
MNFSQNFTYAPNDREVLEDGEYLARITFTKENANIPGALDIFFAFPGHMASCEPNKMTIFSRPVLGTVKKNGEKVTEDDCKKWDFNFSRFIDAFKIDKNYLDNQATWMNKQGWVTVKSRENSQYKNIFIAFNQHEKKDETVPNAVNALADAVGGTVTKDDGKYKKPAENISAENFQEDIF